MSSALDFLVMRYINVRFTYLLTYLLNAALLGLHNNYSIKYTINWVRNPK